MTLLARRVIQGLVIVFLVATLTFALVRLAPGDPVAAMSPTRSLTEETREQLRRNLGLDRPITTQYLAYVSHVMRGDLGTSFIQNRPVWHAIRDRIPETILLALVALLIDYALGVFLGVVQGTRPKSRLDDLLSVTTLTIYSMPVFWLGIILVLVFAYGLGWLPSTGAVDPAVYDSLPLAGKFGDRARHLLLPAATLGLVGAAATARYQRAAMLDVIHQDYVRTARAKGLDERVIRVRHMLRNALLPIITLFGLSFPVLLSGTVLVEPVFGWPGMGRLAAESAAGRDYPVVTGIAIVGALMVVLGNMLADLLYRVIDPRTRAAA